MTQPAVAVSDLRKSYGDLVAVNGISFEVAPGSLFAFLGANGAGKSTTIGCITTTLAPSSGTILVGGFDVVEHAPRVRERIGAVFQAPLLDPLLTTRENLTVRAGLYGLTRRTTAERIARLSELVGLEDFLDRRYGTLSGGQQRRADIARALVHEPAVVFLDEPTAGLDPQSREQIWAAVSELRSTHGTTVFLTTHYMEETERADDVCIVHRGTIVAHGTPAELRARYSSSVLTLRAADATALAARLAARGHEAVERRGDDVLVPVGSALEARDILTGVDIEDFEFRHGTMDDVFLAVTKEVTA